MRLFHKPDGQPLDINFDRLWRLFECRELITYPANQTTFRKWHAAHPSSIPDLAAAVFAQTHLKHPADALLDEAIKYCFQMVEARGYRQTSVDEICRELVPDANHYVLVAGCQGPDVLESRARAVHLLLSKLPHTRFTVVFSGANPAAANTGLRVQESDEAHAMERAFLRLVDEDGSFATQFNTVRESKASRTDENIRHFFEGGYINTARPAVVYLATSTFHIPRLIDIAEPYQKLITAGARLVAVAAEERIATSPVIGTASYVKWMMFTIYEHMLRYGNRSPWSMTPYGYDHGAE